MNETNQTPNGRMVPASAGSAPQRPQYQRNNRRSLYHPPSAAGGAGPPEVYWSEGATPSATQNETFTFYREPTPEPDDKRGAGVGVHSGSLDEESIGRDERRICGVRRIIFWGLVAVALAVLIGVGVGVGVGVGLSKPSPVESSGQESGTPAPSSSGTPETSTEQDTRYEREPLVREIGRLTWPSTQTPTPSTDADSEVTSATSTETASSTSSVDPAYPTQTSSGSLTCPEANYTLYAVPGSPVRFLRLCDVDVTSAHAKDINSVRTESMAECMRNCAGTVDCQGCGWGPQRGDAGTEFWCWLKGELGPERTDLRGWEFAVMQ